MGIFGKLFGRQKSSMDKKQNSNELIEKIKEYSEAEEFIKAGIKNFGDNPVPKIIQQVVSEGFNAETQTMCCIWLCYIGEPAIPHLIACLGDSNYKLAAFAAKTLADMKESLPYLIKALKSENPNTRLHSAGALQFYGPKAVEAIPELCELIKFEINKSGEVDPRNIPEAANNAAGALGKMGEAALNMISQLLKENNVNIRLCAVAALSRIGKPAIDLLRAVETEEKDKLILLAIQNTINRIEPKND